MRQQDIAYELAIKAHAGQFRRDGITPYFNHVQDVARIAQMRGGDDLVITAALLHDVKENCGIDNECLEDYKFDESVIGAVNLLTLDKRISYEDNIRLIKNESKANIAGQIALKVKLADNLSNLSDAPTDKQIIKYAKSLQILMGEH